MSVKQRFNLLLFARKLGMVVLVLFGIELVAFTIRIPGGGWITFQMKKRSESMSTLTKLSRELLAFKEANGTLPKSLDQIRLKITDAWDEPIRYWSDGQQFLLATTPNPDQETDRITWPKSEHSIQTDYFELRPEIILVGGEGPMIEPFPVQKFIFIKFPEGRNAAFKEGPFGLGSRIGNLVYRIEKDIRDQEQSPTTGPR